MRLLDDRMSPLSSRPIRRIASALLTASLIGCATTVPYVGQGPHPQIERGRPVPPIDVIGNVLALPMKLLLFSWTFDFHYVSPQTEETLATYLDAQELPALKATRFQLNEYRPGEDLSRLVHNHYVAWPYRILIGVPVTLFADVVLPGRLFPWGDYYNPYTNTVHLFSDHPAIALHEAGHAHDFASRRYKGTYSALRLIPFVDLYQEYQATKEAIGYLKAIHDQPTELSAYKILYPAYGTYAGSYFFPPIGTIGGALLGHAAGRSTAALTAYEARRHQETPASASPPLSPTPPASTPPNASPTP